MAAVKAELKAEVSVAHLAVRWGPPWAVQKVDH
jgi:hypothetical protein